jgi:hypothetical protein
MVSRCWVPVTKEQGTGQASREGLPLGKSDPAPRSFQFGPRLLGCINGYDLVDDGSDACAVAVGMALL